MDGGTVTMTLNFRPLSKSVSLISSPEGQCVCRVSLKSMKHSETITRNVRKNLRLTFCTRAHRWTNGARFIVSCRTLFGENKKDRTLHHYYPGLFLMEFNFSFWKFYRSLMHLLRTITRYFSRFLIDLWWFYLFILLHIRLKLHYLGGTHIDATANIHYNIITMST